MKLETPTKIICLETQSGPPVPVISLCSIGRSRTNTIVLACSDVSRRHAVIRRDGQDRCTIMDLGSSNGTFVNGARVIHSLEVGDGDLIQIGSARFILRISSPEPRPEIDSFSGEAAARAAEFVPCWLLVGDTGTYDSADSGDFPGEEDCYKTIVSWQQMCGRLVERHHGSIAHPTACKLLAYWPDPDRTLSVAASVADALRDLQPVQARCKMEFRLALHFGSIVIGEERSHGRKALIGTEIAFATGMQGLAWRLSAPCLISEAAHRPLSPLLPTTALPPSGLHSEAGNHRFFTLSAT